MPKTLLDVTCVYLELQDVDVILNALRYAVEGIEDGIRKCNNPDLIEKLQKSLDDANRTTERIIEQLD